MWAKSSGVLIYASAGQISRNRIFRRRFRLPLIVSTYQALLLFLGCRLFVGVSFSLVRHCCVQAAYFFCFWFIFLLLCFIFLICFSVFFSGFFCCFFVFFFCSCLSQALGDFVRLYMLNHKLSSSKADCGRAEPKPQVG